MIDTFPELPEAKTFELPIRFRQVTGDSRRVENEEDLIGFEAETNGNGKEDGTNKKE